ncbi:MAG: divergent PAP2 family protein [Candidatus Gracilibacteria bacterium]|nr:divergent PAP2 family protein [Candidatus Gracilibacteria bacterium]
MEFNTYYQHLILVPAVAFVVTVFLKGVSIKIKTGKLDIAGALGSGGMPSVHSSVVVALATAVAIKYGPSSDLFAISMAFTVIIIYDAINVRFEAGQHAIAINEFIGQKKFKESLGHLPSEAFAGSILGIIVAVVMYYI